MMNNGSEPCDIRIDKDGTWYFKGAEMFRREIVNFFYENLQRDASGQFRIELPGESGDRCFIDVEDTPFVVRSVHELRGQKGQINGFSVALSDDSEERLDPATLRIGLDNVLYCDVKNGKFQARFSRAGYYQLAGHVEYNAGRNLYYIAVNGERYDILNQVL
jgi:uncharacterized protein